jgi:hypothetical protein
VHRHLLRAILALGLVITALSGLGVFATFSDSASGGDDSITSGVRPAVADLRIQVGSLEPIGDYGNVNCDAAAGQLPWQDDNTTTPQFTVTDAQPGQSWTSYVCLKNVGASALSLTVAALDIASVETGCTGDEAQSWDTTCGDGQQGELAGMLQVDIARVLCDNPLSIVYQGATDALIQFAPMLSDLSTTLDPDAVTCVRLKVSYPDLGEVNSQAAQSDQATWHFVFTGTAS